MYCIPVHPSSSRKHGVVLRYKRNHDEGLLFNFFLYSFRFPFSPMLNICLRNETAISSRFVLIGGLPAAQPPGERDTEPAGIEEINLSLSSDQYYDFFAGTAEDRQTGGSPSPDIEDTTDQRINT